MLQIFNERLVVMFFKQKTNMTDGSRQVETKEALEMWRRRGKEDSDKKAPKPAIVRDSLSANGADSINVAKTLKVPHPSIN